MNVIKVPNQVTAAWLLENGACKSSVIIFSELFPDGCAPTLENALIVCKRGLNLNWLARVAFGKSWSYQAYDKKAAYEIIKLLKS